MQKYAKIYKNMQKYIKIYENKKITIFFKIYFVKILISSSSSKKLSSTDSTGCAINL